MSEQPLVSIIVPIYNAQDHIARCVESIRPVSYTHLNRVARVATMFTGFSAVCTALPGVLK